MSAAHQLSSGPFKSVLYVVVSILSLIGLYTIAEPIFTWLQEDEGGAVKANEVRALEEDPASQADPALEDRIKDLKPMRARVNNAVAPKNYPVPTFPNSKIKKATPSVDDVTKIDAALEQRLRNLKPVTPNVRRTIPAKNYALPEFKNGDVNVLPNRKTDITKVDPTLERRIEALNQQARTQEAEKNKYRLPGATNDINFGLAQQRPTDNLPNPGRVTLPDPGRVTLPD